MSKISLNKIKFSQVKKDWELNNELVEELNKIINEIDEYFKNIISTDEYKFIFYNYIFNRKIDFDNEFIQKFLDDLDNNGYSVVISTILTEQVFYGRPFVRTKLTVTFKSIFSQFKI